MITPLEELKKRAWYPSYPQDIRDQMETYKLPQIPLYRFLESSAKYFPDSIAIVHEPENFIVNCRDFYRLCERFGSGLQNTFGVKKGDSVAIYARNYPEFPIAHYGIVMAGGVYVACNPILTGEEIAYQMKDSHAKVIIISEDMVPIIEKVLADKSTALETVIVFERDKELKPALFGGSTTKWFPPFYKYGDVFSDKPLVKPEIDPMVDLAAIIYTSGTTGYPKGVMVSHYNATSSTIQYHSNMTGKFPGLDKDGFVKCENFPRDLTDKWEFPIRYGIDSVLAVTPLTHMMGYLVYMNCAVMAAMTIFPMPVFNTDLMIKMITRWRIAFTGGAPPIMIMLLQRPDADQLDLSSIRGWSTGSAPCPIAVGENFEKKIGGVITEGYAMTESTCSSTKNFCFRSEKRKFGSVGLPKPYTDMKVVDLIDGVTEMPVGQEGELIQCGPQVTLGYLNRPDDTKDVFRDGWLYTGDIGVMDEQGYFYITGRKKELIIYKGYNIAPRMLEEVLYEHPAVGQCAVVGKKDDMAGEIPVAFVALREGEKATPEELMAFVNSKVAGYKKIREVRLIDKIPLNANGKVMRRELAAML